MGEAFRQILAVHKVEHRFSSAFHTQCNGVVEVRNRIIKEVLKKLTGGGVEDWDLMLPWALVAINGSPHSQHGFTPHFVMFGRSFHFPDEVLWEGRRTIDGHVASVLRVHEVTQRIVLEAIEDGELYEYKCLPFGLTISSAIFMHEMFDLLGDIQGVHIYVDDIVIATSQAKHRATVIEVLTRLENKRFNLNWDKCEFEVNLTNFIGYEIGKGSVKVPVNKLQAVEEWETPKTMKGIQKFIGFINYYRDQT